ncbi:metal-binding protein (plasmid) [Aquabacterium olei]|uniref:Metal-binding protein n=1 Tax=Aquabacterium olei TaxID=1296669 RepID=A0A2U8FX56_9BURK|nr:DUF411 domain-containing protein [Aquabacterium olei]AWI55642.1 metal-binding protein [Aquabacterium olei]
MKRRAVLQYALGAVALSALPVSAAPGLPEVEVFKNPNCGCCGAWVDHMKAAGFPVKVVEVEDTGTVRRQVGMPDRFGSCHTAKVAGYALEGHVPAEQVKRLLKTRPQAVGLAVPGMPAGSPGMEMGPRLDPFKVLLVDRSGQSTVFAAYPKA